MLLHWYRSALNLFLPPFCAFCKAFLADNSIFCHECLSTIQPIVSAQISVTASMKMNVFAVSGYQDPLKKLILAKTWSHALAGVHMAEMIWQQTPLPDIDFDILVPIPLHWTRYAWRGFNQAEIMTSRLSMLSRRPVMNILQRSKKTKYQSQLTIHDRLENVHNAFSFNKKNKYEIAGKHIMLVDDLMTTGSTLRAAARALVPLNPSSISAVVTCRVI